MPPSSGMIIPEDNSEHHTCRREKLKSHKLLEIYKELMYCTILLPLFIQYLTEKENLISH
jgi:hypothetical protein